MSAVDGLVVQPGSRVVTIDVEPVPTPLDQEVDNTGHHVGSVLEARAIYLVATALRERGWTQSDLARELGLTPAAVSNVLAGHSARGMSLARLERWMGALGWSVELTSSYVGPVARP